MPVQKFHNPIIPGYSPDPSVCRVGNDFYLVNSTFEFFPGVPIYHSKNLVNWELVGHCLTRESQLPLRGCKNSGGIFAPTIRFHDGRFWMITTNVTDKGNFIVHTEGDDVTGPWSEPAWIDHQGIDPSVIWDDDGKCYYCGTGFNEDGQGIVLFEIDPMTGEILSDKKIISHGCGGKCPEGPHIYKKDGYYYLMAAEGGTEYGHSETIQRSRDIWGPYEGCPHNPILTHSGIRGMGNEIQATGHADIVDSPDGSSYLVCLGIRQYSHAMLHNLGRETFLAPVKWEEGWPIVGDNGVISLEPEFNLPGRVRPQNRDVTLDFAHDFSKHIMFTRNPDMDDYILGKKSKSLTLRGHGRGLNEPQASPTIISIRQPEFVSEYSAILDLTKSNGTGMGISAYYNNDYHYDMYVNFGEGPMGQAVNELFFYKHIHDMGMVISRFQLPIDAKQIKLVIKSDRERYYFYYSVDEGALLYMGSGSNAGLSTEGTMTMTFTGTLFAAYCERGTAVFKDRIELKADVDSHHETELYE